VYWICHIVWVGAFVLDKPCHVVECVFVCLSLFVCVCVCACLYVFACVCAFVCVGV